MAPKSMYGGRGGFGGSVGKNDAVFHGTLLVDLSDKLSNGELFLLDANVGTLRRSVFYLWPIMMLTIMIHA